MPDGFRVVLPSIVLIVVLPASKDVGVVLKPMAIQLLFSLATYGPRTTSLLKSISTNLRMGSGYLGIAAAITIWASKASTSPKMLYPAAAKSIL